MAEIPREETGSSSEESEGNRSSQRPNKCQQVPPPRKLSTEAEQYADGSSKDLPESENRAVGISEHTSRKLATAAEDSQEETAKSDSVSSDYEKPAELKCPGVTEPPDGQEDRSLNMTLDYVKRKNVADQKLSEHSPKKKLEMQNQNFPHKRAKSPAKKVGDSAVDVDSSAAQQTGSSCNQEKTTSAMTPIAYEQHHDSLQPQTGMMRGQFSQLKKPYSEERFQIPGLSSSPRGRGTPGRQLSLQQHGSATAASTSTATLENNGVRPFSRQVRQSSSTTQDQETLNVVSHLDEQLSRYRNSELSIAGEGRTPTYSICPRLQSVDLRLPVLSPERQPTDTSPQVSSTLERQPMDTRQHDSATAGPSTASTEHLDNEERPHASNVQASNSPGEKFRDSELSSAEERFPIPSASAARPQQPLRLPVTPYRSIHSRQHPSRQIINRPTPERQQPGVRQNVPAFPARPPFVRRPQGPGCVPRRQE